MCFILFTLFSCSDQKVNIKNKKSGEMRATKELKQVSTKSFSLDIDTAPVPHYIQIYTDTLKKRQLTFLNTYNNSIYFYNYQSTEFQKKITFEENGPYGVKGPMGYHIKNADSIYIYVKHSEILLANNLGEVTKKTSLIGNLNYRKSTNKWVTRYPSYYVETVTPFMPTSKGLLLTGQFQGDLNDSIIHKFKFTANISYNLDKIDFTDTYPTSLYGNGATWGGAFLTQVFSELHPDGNRKIYSFPVSHHLYISDTEENSYKKVYAGSNYAGTISSLEKTHARSHQRIKSNFVKQDMYAAIIYDKFRKVYYRFLRKAIPNATLDLSWKEKEIAIIIMDENFNYLGETVLGTERKYHWQNSFVTEEGLNIEYLDAADIEEVNLNFRVFVPKDI